MAEPMALPEPDNVTHRPPVHEWGVIDGAGNRSCWWCLATVHPLVAQLHDRWHYSMWSMLREVRRG